MDRPHRILIGTGFPRVEVHLSNDEARALAQHLQVQANRAERGAGGLVAAEIGAAALAVEKSRG